MRTVPVWYSNLRYSRRRGRCRGRCHCRCRRRRRFRRRSTCEKLILLHQSGMNPSRASLKTTTTTPHPSDTHKHSIPHR